MLLTLVGVACDPDDTPDGLPGEPDAGTGGEVDVNLDPAPSRTQPGEYTCSGCPDSDVTSFELDVGEVTRETFSGTVTNAVGNGTFFVEGINGQRLGGTIETDPATGDFTFTTPLFCGEQLVKSVWSNATGPYVLVTRVITANCVTQDIRVIVSWDSLGADWELHLIKPGGRINDRTTDCTWSSCVGMQPDWGVPDDVSDDPKKDVSDTGDYGPENIFLSRPESGLYHVMIEHWGNGSPESDGRLILNVAGKVTVIDIHNLPPKSVWKAAAISWPSGQVTSSTEKYDCSANWSSGCKAPLP